MIRPLRAVAWLAGLVAVAVALRAVATGDLASPPLAAPGELTDWVAARSPVLAAVALGRLVAEVVVWYLLAVSALHAVAALVRFRGADRLADVLASPAARRVVHAGLGLGLVAGSTVAAASPGSPATATRSAAVVPDLGDPAAGTAVAAPSAGTATMAPSAGTATMVPTTGTATMSPTAPTEPPPAAAPTTWEVSPEESFWSIAADVLAERWGRPAADAEVDPYWRALVDANRHRLADPADPDLLHPGQVLELPAPPVA